MYIVIWMDDSACNNLDMYGYANDDETVKISQLKLNCILFIIMISMTPCGSRMNLI